MFLCVHATGEREVRRGSGRQDYHASLGPRPAHQEYYHRTRDPQRGSPWKGSIRMSNLASRIAKDWPDLLNCLYCMSKRVCPYRFLAYENGQDSLDIQLLDLARFVMFQKRSYWRQLKKYRSENNPVIIVMLFNRLNIVYPMLFKLSNKQEEYSLLKYYVTYIGCDSIRRE